MRPFIGNLEERRRRRLAAAEFVERCAGADRRVMTDGGAIESRDTEQTLDGGSHPAHLTKNASNIANTDLPASELTSREFWCRECGRKVTRALERDTEYGHKRCAHSIRHNSDHRLSPKGDVDD